MMNLSILNGYNPLNPDGTVSDQWKRRDTGSYKWEWGYDELIGVIYPIIIAPIYP
jgi:hypothetical protein